MTGKADKPGKSEDLQDKIVIKLPGLSNLLFTYNYEKSIIIRYDGPHDGLCVRFL